MDVRENERFYSSFSASCRKLLFFTQLEEKAKIIKESFFSLQTRLKILYVLLICKLLINMPKDFFFPLFFQLPTILHLTIKMALRMNPSKILPTFALTKVWIYNP